MKTGLAFGLALAFGVALGHGCGGGKPSGFGVNVTVITGAVRDTLATAQLEVTGDETFSKAIDGAQAAAKSGEIRFHYTPKSSSVRIFLAVEARGADGKKLARGATQEITLLQGKAVDAVITLVAGVGLPCGGAGDCPGGICQDGFCCDSPCDGPCEACNLKGKEGICAGTEADVDPQNDCPAKTPPMPMMDTDGGMIDDGGIIDDGGTTPPDAGPTINLPDSGVAFTLASCAGTCNGARACKYPGSTVSCAAPEKFCNTVKDVGRFTCDGTGGCEPKVSMCTAYACADGTGDCRTTCSTKQDCQTGFFCNSNGQCVPQKPDGQACTIAAECSSNACVGVGSPPSATNRVCCNSECNSSSAFSCNAAGVCQCSVTCDTGVGCRLWYKDGDNDNYGDATTPVVIGTNAVVGCESGTNAPPAAGFKVVADNTDCADADSNAHPGQFNFYKVPVNGRGGFDYNCDGVAQHQPIYSGATCGFCSGGGLIIGGGGGGCAKKDTCAAANAQATLACGFTFIGRFICDCCNIANEGFIGDTAAGVDGCGVGKKANYRRCFTCTATAGIANSSTFLDDMGCR